MGNRREFFRDLMQLSILALTAFGNFWPPSAQQTPPPERLKADFKSTIGDNVIELRGHTKAEAKAESRGTLTVLRTASNQQDPEIAA